MSLMDAPSKRVDIVPAKRRAIILEHLRANGAASIQELADAIGGSQSTARRDLEHLVEKGYLERTHGGAVLVQPMRATFEAEPLVNAELRHAEKVAIGREAAKRLSPGDSIILDGSTTVMEAARAAAERNIPLTIVTNSLDIAQLCASVTTWRVIVPGGSVRPGFMNLAGQPGEEFIKSIHADLCLVGASAVSGTLLTDSSLEVASMKRVMISSARKSILLVDSSKFTVAGFTTLCDVSELHEVITDSAISPDALTALKTTERVITVVPMGVEA
ncbi:transcriptional regulator of sugar metabolism [Rhizobium leguminosarum bv. trifolii WSM2012]|nr:transcriptional regulator of sugar metabolism [Rhizobium leguminosarum bv. trifolii WSM2012]EJC76923.1 transcriptional regulator of sugar metabolism [Rhizobium leguminosarum bv. trifolii WSM2012]